MTPGILTLSSLKKGAPEGRFPLPKEAGGRYHHHQYPSPPAKPQSQETNVNGKRVKWKRSLFLLNSLWGHKILRSD